MSFNSRIAAAAFAVAAILATPALAQPSGAAVFKDNCSACHQPAGQGIAGAFPALAGNTFVQGPADVVASTVLNGRGGMPAFRDELSKDDIASVLTFVRSAWGNTAGPIDAATVAAAPGGTPTTPKEPPVLGFH